MNYSFFFRTDASILCLLLFAGSLLMVVLGKFVRRKFISDEHESKGGVNSLLGALFGLWGFLLAFTFSNSSTHFGNVRTTIAEESIIIRNTILRADVFPDSVRNSMRANLKMYLDARIDYYNDVRDFEKFRQTKERARAAGRSLWATTVRQAGQPNMTAATNNMFTSLTNMFDIAARRDAMLLSGVPELVIYMLFLLSLIISFIGGFTTPVLGRKEWIVITGFILLATIIIYITLDLGRPMRGLIRPDVGEDRMIELKKMF